MTKTVENTPRLSIRHLDKDGFLSAGRVHSLSWTQSGRLVRTVSFQYIWSTPPYLNLIFFCGNREIQQRVMLDRTACNYGNWRKWFLCQCGRRAAFLFDADSAFVCRQCLGLSYAVQLEPARCRPLLKAQTIRVKLGGSANMTDPFPEKPRYMHWRTYERLRRKSEIQDQVAFRALLAARL